MDKFHFWQRWLFWVCIFQALFGVILALFGMSVALPGFSEFYFKVFWPNGLVPENLQLFQQWISGVLGATIASWATILAFIVHFPFKRREPWAWRGIVVCLAVWFPIDTGLSILCGVWPNVIFNLAALSMVAIPLWLLRGDFKLNPLHVTKSEVHS